MSEVRLEVVSGQTINHYIEELARLRIAIFRDFPYLYDGDMNYEKKYLKTYIESPDSLIVVALDGDKVVGASTAVPLQYETANAIFPFIDRKYDVKQIIYLGESVLEHAYRGQGIGVRFFEEREKFAKQIGGMKYAAFCGVERPTDHPRKPAEYKPLDEFWQHRGYHKQIGMHTFYSWRDVSETRETSKRMNFWMKEL